MPIPVLLLRAAPIAGAVAYTAATYAAAGFGLVGGLVLGSRALGRFAISSSTKKDVETALSAATAAASVPPSANGLDPHPIQP